MLLMPNTRGNNSSLPKDTRAAGWGARKCLGFYAGRRCTLRRLRKADPIPATIEPSIITGTPRHGPAAKKHAPMRRPNPVRILKRKAVARCSRPAARTPLRLMVVENPLAPSTLQCPRSPLVLWGGPLPLQNVWRWLPRWARYGVLRVRKKSLNRRGRHSPSNTRH